MRSLCYVLSVLILCSVAQAYVISFEDMTSPPSTFNVGDTFTSGGINITGQTFILGGGGTYDGTATLQANGDAGATGNEIWTSNINLYFDFTADPGQALAIQYGDSGGNENLTINGDFKNVNSLTELDGLTVGGTIVTVIEMANGQGALFAIGPIQSFAIGGQEFAIDNIVVGLPEPATMVLMGLGALLLRRRR